MALISIERNRKWWKSDLWPFYLAVLLLSSVRLAEFYPEVFQIVSQLTVHSSPCHSSHCNDEMSEIVYFPSDFPYVICRPSHRPHKMRTIILGHLLELNFVDNGLRIRGIYFFFLRIVIFEFVRIYSNNRDNSSANTNPLPLRDFWYN